MEVFCGPSGDMQKKETTVEVFWSVSGHKYLLTPEYPTYADAVSS